MDLNDQPITPQVEVNITYTRAEIAEWLGVRVESLEDEELVQQIANIMFYNIEGVGLPEDDKFCFNDSENDMVAELINDIVDHKSTIPQRTIDYLDFTGYRREMCEDEEEYEWFASQVTTVLNKLRHEPYPKVLTFVTDQYDWIAKDLRTFVEFLS